MLRKVILSAMLSVIAICSFAQSHGYEYHWLNLGITEDLSSSAVISWATYSDSDATVAQIAPMCITPKVAENATDVPVQTVFVDACERFDKSYPAAYWHKAYFTGLTPETQYLYRIGDGKKWSEWCEFKTAAKGSKPFKFIYFGDVQDRIMDVYPRVARKAFTMAPDAAFVTFVGDLTSGHTHGEFEDFFEANSWMLKQMPVSVIADWHEHDWITADKGEITHLWQNMFTYPDDAPEAATKEGMYSFVCQDCLFISIDMAFLNTDEQNRGATVEWLENVLKDNKCTWIVVAQHQPFYSTGRVGRHEVNHFSTPVKELYAKYGVDLVLSAHDHQYSRFTEKEGGKSVTPVETVTQAGGKCYIPLYNSHADRIGTGTQNFQIVEVSSKQLVYKAYTADGALYDSFIIKNRNGKKKFVDAAQGMPEKTDLDYTSANDKKNESQALENKAAYESRKRK